MEEHALWLIKNHWTAWKEKGLEQKKITTELKKQRENEKTIKTVLEILDAWGSVKKKLTEEVTTHELEESAIRSLVQKKGLQKKGVQAVLTLLSESNTITLRRTGAFFWRKTYYSLKNAKKPGRTDNTKQTQNRKKTTQSGGVGAQAVVEEWPEETKSPRWWVGRCPLPCLIDEAFSDVSGVWLPDKTMVVDEFKNAYKNNKGNTVGDLNLGTGYGRRAFMETAKGYDYSKHTECIARELKKKNKATKNGKKESLTWLKVSEVKYYA